MAKLMEIQVDVQKITKEKLYKGKKGTYLKLIVAVNDEDDAYGNNVSCWEKCEKEETKNYLGNGKVFWSNDEDNNPKKEKVGIEDSDDLPF